MHAGPVTSPAQFMLQLPERDRELTISLAVFIFLTPLPGIAHRPARSPLLTGCHLTYAGSAHIVIHH